MLRRFVFLLVVSAGSLGGRLAAQRPGSDSTLTVDRIFASPEFRGGSLGPLAWLADGISYTTL